MDLDKVRGLLVEMIAAGRQADAIEMVIGLLARLRDQNTRLELDRMRLLRKHLGQTSERVSGNQLDLLMSLLGEAMIPAPKPEDETLSPPAVSLPKGNGKKGNGGRKPLPPHLPRIDIPHPVADADRVCPVCGQTRATIGHEASEVLEFVPAQFRVERHHREKCACKACEEGVAIAPVPDKVIEKGRPGPGLLAHIVVSKYADHLPLNRQRTIYLRDGVDLSPSTMAEWVGAVHKSVEPLVRRCIHHALASHVLQADDTGIKVLDQDAPGGAKRGHLWCYVGDATWAAFDYTPTWEKEGPQTFLAERRGWLVADAYKGYDGLFSRSGATAIEVGCWAHARRGFAELAQAGDARAAPMLLHLRHLYEIESSATDEGVDPDERHRRRQEYSVPILDEIGRLVAKIINDEPPKSALAGAAGYVVNQWTALRRFLEDGRLPIDNTRVERALRPVAVGRKNYLFCGSDTGAERAASAYTLLGTCALVGVDPRAYLKDVLTKLEMQRFPASRIDELLPPNWILTAPEAARVPPRR